MNEIETILLKCFEKASFDVLGENRLIDRRINPIDELKDKIVERFMLHWETYKGSIEDHLKTGISFSDATEKVRMLIEENASGKFSHSQFTFNAVKLSNLIPK